MDLFAKEYTKPCPEPIGIEILKESIKDVSFEKFAKEAYENPDGYSTRVNPLTGKKEMFIAGTRNRYEWFLNSLDLYTLQTKGKWIDPWRKKKQEFFEKAAVTEGVDVIYGHSRGGAYIADMELPKCVQRVGLDAAMIISNNKNILNLNEGGGLNPLGSFDEILARGGKHNVTVDYSPWAPHKVWTVTNSSPKREFLGRSQTYSCR